MSIYMWMWRKLPGTTPQKSTLAALAVIAGIAVLWFIVFPVVEPLISPGAVVYR